MTTRSLSALLTTVLGCLLLAASCAKPSPGGDPGTGGANGTGGTGMTCGAGQMNCSGQCKTVATDNQNCGSCGNACGATRACQNGTCVCPTGLLDCNGSCVTSDASHCGSCTTVCTAPQVCNGTSCASMCPTDRPLMCGTTCVPTGGDGTIAHCGGCNACPTGANACNSGVCGCAGGANQMLCGTSCVDTNTSNSHCGGCNIPCTNGSCVGGTCMAATGTAGTTGRGGTTGAGGMGTAGTGAGGTTGGTTGRGGTTGTAGAGGRGGTTGTGGTVAGTPPGWWTSGSMHGCPWTGIDIYNVGSMNTPTEFVTKNDSFATPYCISGTVGPEPMYRGVSLLGFNLNETPNGQSNQCAYKAADPTALGPPAIQVTGSGIAVNFSRTVGSVLRIQIQDEMGGLAPPVGDEHRWCYTITDVQGPVFAPWNRFNTKCWDQMGTNFNPATNRVSAIVFTSPGNLVSNKFGYCIGGFAFGNDVSAAPAYNPSASMLTVAGTIGGAGSTDLDYYRVKVAPPGTRPGGTGYKQYILQNNNWGNASGNNQTIMYTGNSFTITGETTTGSGTGVPASYPSLYVGNNGDTQNKNDPPKGSYTTKGNDNLPRQISQMASAMTTASYNRASGDYNAAYDIWLATGVPTSDYNDALNAFVMVWLYTPGGRSPIGGSPRVMNKSIGGNSYNVWAGPRNSGTDGQRPVISYVATSTVMSRTFDLKPLLDDALANDTSYGVRDIPSTAYVTDIFFGFEIWNGSGTNGLSVTNFSVDVK